MKFPRMVRELLDRRGFRFVLVTLVRLARSKGKFVLVTLVNRLARSKGKFVLVTLVNRLARSKGKDVKKVSYKDGLWIHKTSHGYFAYPAPKIRLDMALNDELTRDHFLWGYTPKACDVVMDVGAGMGEEVLTFSREVGEGGKVICVEAHPRTYRCLEKIVQLNQLENVITLQYAVAEPFCVMTTIEDSDNYQSNRSHSSTGIPVTGTTIDAIYQKLGLGRISFLKMNIEGAERLAIKGMSETIRRTEVLCVSCHDFLAEENGDDFFRTKNTVKYFFRQNGLKVVERAQKGLPPCLSDQVWAYNEVLMKGQVAR